METENGWHAKALTTFHCELSANTDVMELVLVRAAPYFFANSLSGNTFLKSRPAWYEADSRMLCSTRNYASSNSECVTSADRSTLANDYTDSWNCAADVAFKCFCVAQYFPRLPRPPCTMLTSQRRRLQITKVSPNIGSYTLKLVTVLNLKLLFIFSTLFSSSSVACSTTGA